MKVSLPVFNYTVGNKSSDNSLDVYIDGAIVDAETEQLLKDFFGDTTSVSYKTFRNQINEAAPSVLNIFCTGPGGDIGDALAMHDYLIDLQNKGTTVNTTNRGMVASALTYFQMAVPIDNRFASANSFIVIHNVQGGVQGDLRTMESYVSNATKLNKNIIDMYVNGSNLSVQKVMDMMDAETLLTPEQMVNYGFILPKNITSSAPVKNTVDISKYAFKNNAVLNAYNNLIHKPNTSEMEVNKITEAITNGFNGLMEKLGISNKKEDAEVQAAFTNFSESIVNSIKESVPTAETITNQVNEAVTAALAGIDGNEGFKNAIAAAIANTATKEEVTNAVTEGLKNTVVKTDLENTKTDILNAVADKIGGKSTEKPAAVTNRKPSRFAGVNWGE